jgi:hypothetical protein
VNIKPLLHRAPSVGSLTKKLLEINPELSTGEIIEIVRKSSSQLGKGSGDFASAEVVDEERAIALALATLKKRG